MARLKAKYKSFMNVAEEHGFISPLVHVGQFKEECELLLPKSVMDFTTKEEFSVENLAKELDVDEATVKELEEVCSPSSLVCPREGEVLVWDDANCIPKDTGLITLSHRRKNLVEKVLKPSKKSRLLHCKYTEMDCALLARTHGIPAKDDKDQVTCPEIVITVSVSFPRDERRYKACCSDIYVLGSQPLGNFTENPDLPRDICLKDICTSSFFCFENTFFNDLRNPSSVDLSKDIIEWAKTNETAVPDNAQVASMDECTFNDLRIRLGCPYVFLHQGDCEHQIHFKDIRLFNGTDCQSRSAYPITVSKAHLKGQTCKVCNFHQATWYTRYDSLADTDPAFFCEFCFKLLHYDKSGNKLGEFTAFPYIPAFALNY
ncbi:snRNA-activating protein complex subunit 3-like isoform X2 [Clavelina lepadiformis]|uniref:snRNA-activating protein complex subunit 3 n=1 Tax=Clavelina lepadiformis TaxID=159417 RepID=A0ABP0GVH5_CLALP